MTDNPKEKNNQHEIEELQKIISEKNNEIFQLKRIIDNIPGDIYWKDKEGVYLGLNVTGSESLRRMGFTWKESDIVGKTDYDLYEKRTADKFRANDLKVIQTGLELAKEEPAILPSGEKIIQLSTKRPLLNKDGHVIGIIGNTIDITYLKKIESDLRTAKELAESASKAKSDFISNMSHDLRTPITGILGVAQDLLNTAQESDAVLRNNTPPSPEESLNLTQHLIHHVKNDTITVINAVVPLINLCDEILETTRLGKGVSSQPPESFDAHELIEQNVALLQPTARNRKLGLTANIDKRVPKYIHGLRTYIDRTLINLISNALKFTEKGYVKVTMSLLENAPVSYKKGDKVTLQISIEDTGIGIPEDKHEAIFEHFSRLNASHEGIYKGYGLGLYTVRVYIKAMKGNIKVESHPGKGTSFKITLPFIVSDKADRPRDTSFSIPVESISESKTHTSFSVSSSAATKANSTPSSKVLVVEDNPTAARALMAGLRPFNCDVDVAENGTQAIEMAQNNSYDIILMDVGLPDISGIEATKAIRLLSDIKKAQVPIVAITGHADSPEIRQECLDAGMQDVLSKPARPLLLEAVFQRFVFKGMDKEAFEKTSPANKSAALTKNISDLSILDWEASEHMCGGDRKGLYEILVILSPDLKVSAEVFAKTYSNRDIMAIRAELHRAIGGVVYICAPRLETALKAFQKAIKTEPPDWDACDRLYNDMQEMIAAFQKEYEKGGV